MASRRARLIALLGAGVMAVAAGAAQAAETGLSGMWMIDRDSFRHRTPPSLTPEAAAYVEAHKGQVMSAGNKRCMPYGMPAMIVTELAIQIVESPERIAIISEQTQLPRTIYLNTTKHPDPMEVAPSWNGHSYGKWEGQTLVVDTANFNDRVSHVPGAMLTSLTTHLSEKMHLEDGGQTLVNKMTFWDPKLLTKPLVQTFRYHRMPAGAEIWEYVCDLEDEGWTTALGDRPPGGGD
jgi:hypothetical protein